MGADKDTGNGGMPSSSMVFGIAERNIEAAIADINAAIVLAGYVTQMADIFAQLDDDVARLWGAPQEDVPRQA